ncbi:MAG: DUF368 domain-containing protein [Bacteroidetes bacterium]|nr:MAG: DUF368 domain-containing protein [Bacteroidota bacterium]TNF00411.1 MAG: DUF368 domain-containing protein [Bacteroidota bacterium]
MENRNLMGYLMISLKGVAMGAADIVPGVSGGTIAFISGIYEELITSINNVNLEALRKLTKEGVKSFWSHINGNFLFMLLLGIGTGVASLAGIVSFLLENHPILIWSFFFGLILASIWLVAKTIDKWSLGAITAMIIGIAIALYISTVQTVAHVEGSWFIFLSGAIAICAMILPGISGSFILVLLGSYHQVLQAVKDKDLILISIFIGGCAVGLISFSRLLKYLFSKFKSITIALLAGFMIGALYKVWPWKVNIGDAPIVVHSNGKEDWMTANVWPADFSGDAQLLWAVLCAVIGLGLIIGIEKIATKK